MATSITASSTKGTTSLAITLLPANGPGTMLGGRAKGSGLLCNHGPLPGEKAMLPRSGNS